MAKLITPAFFSDVVNAGEQRLLNFLEISLPDSYILIPNVELVSTNPRNHRTQYWEYDILVVAPHAIYNIENKDWRGRLEGDDNYWYLNDRQRPNPIKTNALKTRILHSKLQEYRSSWGRIRVQNVVSLSHVYQTKNGLSGDASNITFLLDEELIEFIQSSEIAGVEENSILANQKEIVDYLVGEQTERNIEDKKEVLIYEVVEVLDREENYTEYLCKPKGVTSSIRMRVKEYALSIVGLSPEELRVREEQIKNQYKALNKIKVKNFFQSVKFDFDEENHYFYEITDYLGESSLRAEMNSKTFTNEQRLNIIYNVISALKEAHKENIYHRDINPDNIFIYNGYAYLGNFGKSYFTDHSDEGYTVMATLSELNVSPYNAFELLSKDASRASDIYSLGVLIYELYTGVVPIKTPFELDKLGGQLPKEKLPSSINPNLPLWLDKLCDKTILVDDEKRFDDLEELEQFIKESNSSETTKSEVVEKNIQEPHDRFDIKVGENIGVYTIKKELGKGGYSKVFKVQHGLQSKVYAMKLFHESVSLNSVIDEYGALRELDHPNIVKFVWNDRINGQFYTLMEYLDGEDMSTYARGELSLPVAKSYQLAKDMIDALVELQNQQPVLIHRDIKPQNIIWDSKKRFVLIDFNVASVFDANTDYVGTNPYIAPDLIKENMKVEWDTSADTFALGISLYELVCKNYPWTEKMPRLSKQPIHPHEFNEKLSDSFASFIYKAIQTKKSDRFSSAKDMQIALEAIDETDLLKLADQASIGEILEIDEEVKKEDIVDYLNSLYSQSKNGNAGTRARLESIAFDRLTYVETKLDTKLLPSILDGTYKLVIITGNAGDGKTAFIKRIEEKASSSLKFDNRNGATFKINGVSYISNYDGSQDEEEKANDQVLEEFFHAFEGIEHFNEASEGRIIAINEGRLADFLNKSGKHKRLETVIEDYFHEDGNTQLPDGLLIINLNLRSVVASDAENKQKSILRKQIESITNPTLWGKCEKCAMSDKCFIRFNVQSLNDTSAGSEIIKRLEWLLRTISYKRELHITIRDIRSFIAWMLTRDYKCDEIRSLFERTKIEEYWNLFYFNISAPQQDNAINDRLIKIIWETDIALSAVPSIDRDLYFSSHNISKFISFENREYDLLDSFNDSRIILPAHEQDEESQKRIREMHSSYRRHHYFEGKKMYHNRLPYQSVYDFYNLIKPQIEGDDLVGAAKTGISKAIALSEGCNNESAYMNYIVLSSNQVRDPIAKSFRRFPLSEFELKINQPMHLVQYLEYEPDSLIFKHISKNNKHVRLVISLDLYEMLHFISNGYSPSLNDLRGRYIELQIFKNLLENLEYNEVLVTKDNLDFYSISKQINGKLKLESVKMK